MAETSQADIHIIERIKRALELVNVRLLNHFVVGDGSPVLLAERELVYSVVLSIHLERIVLFPCTVCWVDQILTKILAQSRKL